jgi:ABC-type tungstate transport system substrate-binding protein
VTLNEILGSIIRIMPILVGVKRVALYRWDADREAFTASQEYGFSEMEEAIMTEREFTAGVFPLLIMCVSRMRW